MIVFAFDLLPCAFQEVSLESCSRINGDEGARQIILQNGDLLKSHKSLYNKRDGNLGTDRCGNG